MKLYVRLFGSPQLRLVLFYAVSRAWEGVRPDWSLMVLWLYTKTARILLANSNQWYFNKLVKIPCHKTPYRCPHRLNLSSQSTVLALGQILRY
jgi:hypothetical protein